MLLEVLEGLFEEAHQFIAAMESVPEGVSAPLKGKFTPVKLGPRARAWNLASRLLLSQTLECLLVDIDTSF